MWFLTIVTYFAIFVQLVFITVSIAAGLYYLAEIVEEYTVIAKNSIWWTNTVILVLYLLLWILERFPVGMMIGGITSQIVHYLILKDFPYVTFVSPGFITALVLLAVNHYLAFSFFGNALYSFSEVMAYFTLYLWVVPFALLVSLSANENVLPTMTDQGKDVVTNYFSKRGKKYGLLSFFNYAKESLLPQRNKKGF